MIARRFRAAAALVAAVLLFTACTSGDGIPRPPKGSTSPSSSATPTTAWRRCADAPTARQEVAAAVVGSKVYVVGGLVESGGATDAVEIYDPSSDSWTAGPKLPLAAHHLMAATRNGELVVMGGFRGDLGGAATDRVFILRNGRWIEGPTLRRPRGAAAAVAVGDEIVLVGGISGGRHVAPVEIFDGTGWRDGETIPNARDHLAAATDGDFVYVAGGRRAGEHFNTFEGYDAHNDRWGPSSGVMPTARSGLGAAVVGRTFVTVGGEGPRMFPEVEAYDAAAGRWRRLPDLAVPVHGVGVVAFDRKIYALVGGTRVGAAASRVCQVLTIR